MVPWRGIWVRRRTQLQLWVIVDDVVRGNRRVDFALGLVDLAATATSMCSPSVGGKPYARDSGIMPQL